MLLNMKMTSMAGVFCRMLNAICTVCMGFSSFTHVCLHIAYRPVQQIKTYCKQALHSAFTKFPPLIITSPCSKQLDLSFHSATYYQPLCFQLFFYLSSVNHIHGTSCRSLINQMWTTHNAYTNSDSRGRENYESRYIQCNEVLNLRKSFHLTGLVL